MVKKHLFMSIFGMLLIFILFVPSIHAQANTYIVGADDVHVRQAPSQQANVIGNLHAGNKLKIFGEKYGWVKTYYNGQVGWVASQLLYPDKKTSKTEHTTRTVKKKTTITSNSVRIRKGPGTRYKITGFAMKGNKFTVLTTKNNWIKVSLKNQKTGWIAAWLTTSGDQSSNKELAMNHPKRSLDLTGKTIVLDAGHGGLDPGSSAIDGSYEKDMTAQTAITVANTLRQHGAQVYLTRSNDHYVSLHSRVIFSNRHHPDAFISLHYNAYPLSTVNGISTHFYTDNGHDKRLAGDIQSALSKQVTLKNRGINQSNYYVLRENSDLAVLVELGFITNPYDLSTIQTTTFKRRVATGITNGLIHYFK